MSRSGETIKLIAFLADVGQAVCETAMESKLFSRLVVDIEDDNGKWKKQVWVRLW